METPYRANNLTQAPLEHYMGRLQEADPQEIAQRLALSEDFVMIEALDTYRECRKNGDAKNALKSLELMGRHLGMFEKPKKQGEGGDDKLEDLL